jgi:hypothetical protein
MIEKTGSDFELPVNHSLYIAECLKIKQRDENGRATSVYLIQLGLFETCLIRNTVAFSDLKDYISGRKKWVR